MTKTRFTFDEHVSMAQDLRVAEDILQRAVVKLGAAYPFSVFEKTILKSIGQINRLRSKLEDEMFREGHPEAEPAVYYHVRNWSLEPLPEGATFAEFMCREESVYLL